MVEGVQQGPVLVGTFTLKTSHSFSFQPPTDLPIPTLLMTPEQLLPFIQDLLKPHSSPPIPQGGTPGPSCRLGVHVSLPAFQQRLFSRDLHEWKCPKHTRCLSAHPFKHYGFTLMVRKKNHSLAQRQLFSSTMPLRSPLPSLPPFAGRVMQSFGHFFPVCASSGFTSQTSTSASFQITVR